MGWARCKRCGVPKAELWMAKPMNTNLRGCARSDTGDHDGFCTSMRIDLLQMALRRAVAPDAFDQNGRMKEGEYFRVIELERDALRAAALTKGPMAVDTNGEADDG